MIVDAMASVTSGLLVGLIRLYVHFLFWLVIHGQLESCDPGSRDLALTHQGEHGREPVWAWLFRGRFPPLRDEAVHPTIGVFHTPCGGGGEWAWG
jgi:hypothetical protein